MLSVIEAYVVFTGVQDIMLSTYFVPSYNWFVDILDGTDSYVEFVITE